jgi:hypothetical protein
VINKHFEAGNNGDFAEFISVAASGFQTANRELPQISFIDVE